MKILMNTTPTSFQAIGGGGIVALKTAQYLKELKVKVSLFNYWQDKISDYDILHNVGTASVCYDVINSAYAQKVPVALTTIYDFHSLSYIIKSQIPLDTKLKQIAYNSINKYFQRFSKVKKMLDQSSILFPDTWMEGSFLIKNFKIPRNKVFPVPHGVDERFMYASQNLFYKRYGLKDFVLYVGRIDIRKNVLSLIRALKNTDIDLVIIGESEPDQQLYFDKCKRESNKKVHFLGQFLHESKLLESAYATAKVVTLPADYETPGLVGLEAGLARANVVITKRGSTKDYYKDHVWYVNPDDIKDIRNVLHKFKRNDIKLIQVLDRTESKLNLEGDFRLKDLESNSVLRTYISPYLKKRYQEQLVEHNKELRKIAMELGGRFFTVSTDMTIFDAMFLTLVDRPLRI